MGGELRCCSDQARTASSSREKVCPPALASPALLLLALLLLLLDLLLLLLLRLRLRLLLLHHLRLEVGLPPYPCRRLRAARSANTSRYRLAIASSALGSPASSLR